MKLKLSNQYLAYIALATAGILWGITLPFMKITMLHMPLYSLAFIRFFVAALILFPFIQPHEKLQKKDMLFLLICALLGVTFTISFAFWGLKLTTATNAGLISGTMPIFSIFLAHIFLKEKYNKKIIFGAILGLLGVFTIIGKDLLATGISFSPLGDILSFLYVVSFAAYGTISKSLLKILTPITLTMYTFAIGSLTFLPLAVLDYTKNPSWMMHLPLISILGILFGIFGSSLGAFSLWQYGLSKFPETKAGFFYYLVPVVSTFLSISLLHEKLTLTAFIGAGLILLGLIVAEVKSGHTKHFH